MSDYIHRFTPFGGTWSVDQKLGEGSYGTVWQVRQDTGSEVRYAAVKEVVIPAEGCNLDTIHAQGMDETGAAYYFRNLLEETLNEVELMQKLASCEYVVHYEDFQVQELKGENEFGWVIFMRMERLVPFSSYMAKKRLEVTDVVRLGINISRALEACLEEGIVHRDIKPDNLFYCPESNSFKLGDFGIAHYLARPTQGKGRAGTLTHMTPEVYSGEPYTPEDDLYALGMVLYRLMNDNRVPFLPPYPEPFSPVQRNEALVRRLRGAEPNDTRVVTLNSQEPKEMLRALAGSLAVSFDSESLKLAVSLGRIAHRAIASEKKRRFASATALREALEKAYRDFYPYQDS